MKKLLPVLVLALLAAGTYALDFGAGGGVSVATACRQFSAEQYGIWDSYKDRFTTVPVGFTAFFDATYAQVAVGLLTNGNTHETWTGVIGGSTITNGADDNYCSGFLSLALMGKYPFALGRFTVFPLLGIQYDMNLWARDETGVDLKASMTDQQKAELNQFWFKGGAGVDFTLAKNLSLRSQVTLGFKLLNQAERDRVETAESGGAMKVSQVDTTLDLGVSLQYRFASIGITRR